MRLALLQSAQLMSSAKEVKLVLKVGSTVKSKKPAAPRKASVSGMWLCRVDVELLLNRPRHSQRESTGRRACCCQEEKEDAQSSDQWIIGRGFQGR